MDSSYDIYDDESANLVGSFPTAEAALAMVHRAIKRSGRQSVASWSLGTTDLTGEVLSGKNLIERAMRIPV